MQNTDRSGLLAILRQHPFDIKNINHPDRELQMAAVRSNPLAILYIDFPDMKVREEAVRRDGSLIDKYVLLETEHLAAVALVEGKYYPAISHIRNPSDSLKRKAVEISGFALEYIDNYSQELAAAAVARTPRAIRFVSNPPEDMQLSAVTAEPGCISDIDSPTEAVQIYAVSHDADTIRWIRNPCREAERIAVCKDPFLIGKCQTQYDESQIQAVKSNHRAFYMIDKPCTAACNIFAQREIDDDYLYGGYAKWPLEAQKFLASEGHRSKVISAFNSLCDDAKILALQRREIDFSVKLSCGNNSESVQIAAVTSRYNYLHYLHKPTDKVLLAAVKASRKAFRWINNPSEKLLASLDLNDIESAGKMMNLRDNTVTDLSSGKKYSITLPPYLPDFSLLTLDRSELERLLSGKGVLIDKMPFALSMTPSGYRLWNVGSCSSNSCRNETELEH